MDDEPTRFEALLAVVDQLGSQAELARLCGVSPTAVWKWVQSGKELPAQYVLRAEARTGVSRHHLRPDIYPIEPKVARFHGVDGRATRVAFNRSTVSKAATA